MVSDSDSDVASAALQQCVSDLAPLITQRSVLLIGEVPGTNELPQLVDLVVERAIVEGLDVVVGLEIPMTEDLHLGETGSFFDRGSQYQDGRSTAAVGGLIRRLAARRRDRASAGSQRLEVVAMDGPWVAPGSPVPLDMLGVLEQPRDEVMAANLLAAMDATPAAFTLVVAGPMHTRIDRTASQTLGRLISAWHPQTVALRVTPASGETWVLTEAGRGEARILPTVDTPPGALWAASPGADGHHGVLNPGLVTASGPLAES